MKFVFADSLDFVDPRYDFLSDRHAEDRENYWDDQFPHEILGYSPYDGILVSRAMVGGVAQSGRYTESQMMRFRRVGAREFLRFPEREYPGSVVFGDCGAFSYSNMEEPPYTAEDMIDFYGDGRFTHGCSIDHIIFDFLDLSPVDELDYEKSQDDQAQENRRRYSITLENACDFIKRSKRLGNSFTPLGAIQGWSPLSMAKAARELVRMGYTYLALGGLVPLQAEQIHKALDAIRAEIGFDVSLHLLGFAKADQIAEFQRHNIASFDTTSPLLRAFKDGRNNYYLPGDDGQLEYFTAIRIPQAIENNSLKRLVKEGAYSQEDLQDREQQALSLIRAYDRSEAELEDVLESVINYTKSLVCGCDEGFSESDERKLSQIRERTHRTLKAKPWQRCSCEVCKQASVEVIIFRASNRNKRRGIHNLSVYGQHIKNLEDLGSYEKVANF